jgi:hypothetical protein
VLQLPVVQPGRQGGSARAGPCQTRAGTSAGHPRSVAREQHLAPALSTTAGEIGGLARFQAPQRATAPMSPAASYSNGVPVSCS